MSLQERCAIEIRWCRDEKTVTEIATELRRNKSSLSRELQGKPRRGYGKYNADLAHRRALERIGKRGNVEKTKRYPALKTYIEEKLELGWSPEQIHLRLPLEYKKDTTMRIATEAVYQEVYRRVRRGGNGRVKDGVKDLRPFLARRHTRRAKKGFRKAQKQERNATLPSIELRPRIVEKRSRIGDWEDDTLVSRANAVRLKSMNERRSGVHLFGKTKDATAQACDAVLMQRLSQLPLSVRKTLTRDRGAENLRWKEVSQKLAVEVFFAHPYASYERGSNENGNGLMRRFFPKKTDWDKVSDEDIHRAEWLINNRPRKRLGGYTPCEVFFRLTGVALYS